MIMCLSMLTRVYVSVGSQSLMKHCKYKVYVRSECIQYRLVCFDINETHNPHYLQFLTVFYISSGSETLLLKRIKKRRYLLKTTVSHKWKVSPE